MSAVEIRSRLESVRDVCEYERRSLEALEDPRLEQVLGAMAALSDVIAAVLAELPRPPTDGN